MPDESLGVIAQGARTWAAWRTDFESQGLLQPQSPQSRARRASQVSPLVPLSVLDEYEISVSWDLSLEMYVARCRQVPFVWWPHPTSPENAIIALAMYLQALIVGLNSDLCLVPDVSAKSDAAEQRWHRSEVDAREAFLAALTVTDEGKPA